MGHGASLPISRKYQASGAEPWRISCEALKAAAADESQLSPAKREQFAYVKRFVKAAEAQGRVEGVALELLCRAAHRADASSATDSRTDDELAFHALDAEGLGSIGVDELVALFTHFSPGDDHAAISSIVDDAASIVRDVDTRGDGRISRSDLNRIVTEIGPHPPPPTAHCGATTNSDVPLPHLSLFFDVNNTILMHDSATGGDASNMLATVLASVAWGRADADGAGDAPMTWMLASAKLSVQSPSPSEGLITYKTHVDRVFANSAAGGAPSVNRDKRALLRRFVDDGCPGAALRSELERLRAALPSGLRSDDPKPLLPSFLRAVRELKRRGRSFSVCFRTFGHDLEGVLEEYNACCKGTHPLFPGGRDPNDEDASVVLLDGSDGSTDYTVLLQGEQCGTFLRIPRSSLLAAERERAPAADKDMRNDAPEASEAFEGSPSAAELKLVLGTIEQPGSLSDGLQMYHSLSMSPRLETSPRQHVGVRLETSPRPHVGVRVLVQRSEIAAWLADATGARCGTLALRDHYAGWDATGSSASGGKPLFVEDPPQAQGNGELRHVLQIFFDDHIGPRNAKIVDARRAMSGSGYPSPPPLPIAAVFGLNLVQAQPLRAIEEPNYFLDEIAACEREYAAKLSRRQRLRCALDELAVLHRALTTMVPPQSPPPPPRGSGTVGVPHIVGAGGDVYVPDDEESSDEKDWANPPSPVSVHAHDIMMLQLPHNNPRGSAAAAASPHARLAVLSTPPAAGVALEHALPPLQHRSAMSLETSLDWPPRFSTPPLSVGRVRPPKQRTLTFGQPPPEAHNLPERRHQPRTGFAMGKLPLPAFKPSFSGTGHARQGVTSSSGGDSSALPGLQRRRRSKLQEQRGKPVRKSKDGHTLLLESLGFDIDQSR